SGPTRHNTTRHDTTARSRSRSTRTVTHINTHATLATRTQRLKCVEQAATDETAALDAMSQLIESLMQSLES
ncbi:MAG: hypothetical protein ACK57P_08560, partial [Planctomycetota bacterium]